MKGKLNRLERMRRTMSKLTKDEADQVASERLTKEVRIKLANSAYRLVNYLDKLTEEVSTIAYIDSKDFCNEVEGMSYITDTLYAIGRLVTMDIDDLVSRYSDAFVDARESLMEDENEKVRSN